MSQAIARARKFSIPKPIWFLRLALCFTVLRSRWCQVAEVLTSLSGAGTHADGDVEIVRGAPSHSRETGDAGSAKVSFFPGGWAQSLTHTRANLPEARPVDRIVMRLRSPSLVGRERSWQIPRILGSFAAIAEPRTNRRTASAVRVERHWHLQLDVLSAILFSLERQPGGDAHRRASTLE
jgi:hypothetical protein